MHQLSLPGVVSEINFKRKSKQKLHRLKTMSLQEGLEYINQPKLRNHPRMMHGYIIENINKSSATRLKLFKLGQITCVECGLVGDQFHIERHKNDKVFPFAVNLYGQKGGKEVMLTWDHIIPRSYGGSNSIENAQCMCSDCNSRKGNILPIMEIVEVLSRPMAHLMYATLQIDSRLTIQDTINLVSAELQELFKNQEDEITQ